jgi:hypothetical protein
MQVGWERCLAIYVNQQQQQQHRPPCWGCSHSCLGRASSTMQVRLGGW